jgi:hypothetical protein
MELVGGEAHASASPASATTAMVGLASESFVPIGGERQATNRHGAGADA